MAIYFIDFENVNCDGLEGIDKLKEEDTVHLFYSASANKITFKVHLLISTCKAKFCYHEVKTGKKNALDFQLVTYLGYLVGKYKDSQFLIVSKDEGFGFVVDFWKEQDVDIAQIINLLQENDEAPLPPEVEKLLEPLFTNFQKEIPIIASCIRKYKTKQGINNALVKRYESKKAGEIYKILKPLLKNKN